MIRSLTAFLFCFLSTSFAAAGTVSSFDDILFWAGTGSNRAALAIDWFGDDTSDTALVWGYRWDGIATGEQMLRDVVAADNRLYTKISTTGSLGISVWGWGYDQNDDDSFALDDNTSFNADGIAVTSASDGAEAVDPADRYREGWSTGYWHYAHSASTPTGQIANWVSSGSGVSGRTLSDGEWNSHAFAVTLNGDEFAMNLLAAEPEYLLGDFNLDGQVDAADYTVWRDGLGTEYTASQYDDWVINYGLNSVISSNTMTVPVPSTASLLLLLLGLLGLRRPASPSTLKGTSA